MLGQRIAQYAGYLCVRIAICVLQSLSLDACDQVARGMAVLCCDVLRLRRGLIDENLRHAYPHWPAGRRRREARRMWRHLFLLVAEVAHLPRKVHDTNWRDYVSLIGHREMMRHLLSDRTCMLVAAHFGNFELAGYVMGLLGFPTYTVARTLDNPYLDRFVNQFRGATGQYIIPKKGGYDQIVEVLARRGVMSFLADQYAGVKGCWVDFFGRPASAHKAIALLAFEHDAIVVVGSARRVKGPLQYRMGAEDDAFADPRSGAPEVANVRAMTQWYTRQIEKVVRQAPEQYWWLHRRWKDTRPVKQKARAAA